MEGEWDPVSLSRRGHVAEQQALPLYHSLAGGCTDIKQELPGWGGGALILHLLSPLPGNTFL